MDKRKARQRLVLSTLQTFPETRNNQKELLLRVWEAAKIITKLKDKLDKQNQERLL